MSPTPAIADPDPAFVSLLAELAAVTVNMPDQTRTKLLDLWEQEGPADLDGLRKEIATLKAALKEESVHESFTAAQGDALARKAPVSQAASAFVDGLDVDTDEANGGISPEQYEALGKLLVAFGVDLFGHAAGWLKPLDFTDPRAAIAFEVAVMAVIANIVYSRWWQGQVGLPGDPATT